MRIAPIDIAHKNFSRKVMGYDADDVTDFLRDVADQMEEIIRERNQLKEAMREKELAIMEYKQRDETLKATIATATKMSEQIRLDAEREGKLIVHDAQQKAEMITKDARDSLKRIYQEINDVKRGRIQFETSLRSLLHAHMSMLDQAHMMLPEMPMPSQSAHAQNQQVFSAQLNNHFVAESPSPQAQQQLHLQQQMQHQQMMRQQHAQQQSQAQGQSPSPAQRLATNAAPATPTVQNSERISPLPR